MVTFAGGFSKWQDFADIRSTVRESARMLLLSCCHLLFARIQTFTTK